MDDSWGVVRDTSRLLNEFGWYKGDFFRAWIGNLIREKTGSEHATFLELQKQGCPDLYLVGTNLSTGFSEVFSVEHTPRMCVADAARRSMSIPLFFAAVRNDRKDVFVDGGVFANYPIKLFDREKYLTDDTRRKHGRQTDYYRAVSKRAPSRSSRYIYNKETLGFRLDTGREIAMFRDGAEPPHTRIDDFFDYAKALIGALMSAQDNQHLHSDDWHRTVYINTLGVGTTDFHLPDEKKKALVREGSKGTKKYFEWYDALDPKNPAINHPSHK
jgi:NTE family protein